MSRTAPSQRAHSLDTGRVHAGWFRQTEIRIPPRLRRAPTVVPRHHHLGHYRVEFCTTEGRTLLCAEVHCFPHHTALAPFASHLRLNGAAAGGWLILVDPASEAIVARRRVLPAN